MLFSLLVSFFTSFVMIFFYTSDRFEVSFSEEPLRLLCLPFITKLVHMVSLGLTVKVPPF